MSKIRCSFYNHNKKTFDQVEVDDDMRVYPCCYYYLRYKKGKIDKNDPFLKLDTLLTRNSMENIIADFNNIFNEKNWNDSNACSLLCKKCKMKKIAIKNNVSYGTLCVMPWLSLRNHTGQHFTICCYSDLKIDKKEFVEDNLSYDEVWNSMQFRNLRRDLLNGVKPVCCKSCWKDEEKGILSNRQKFNEIYLDKINDLLKSTKENGHLSKKPFISDVDFDVPLRECQIDI